jgi:hypothetical protein
LVQRARDFIDYDYDYEHEQEYEKSNIGPQTSNMYGGEGGIIQSCALALELDPAVAGF